MKELATFTTADEQGRDVLVRACDGRIVAREHPSGSILYTDGGGQLVVAMTVADMHTTIDALWTELMTAITG